MNDMQQEVVLTRDVNATLIPHGEEFTLGRNEKVTIQKGEETQVIKYKKAKPFLDDGWIVQ